MHGLVDEVGAVVEGDDLHVLGQDAGVELLGLRLDALQHVLRLLAGAKHDDAFDGVVLLADAELAEPRRDAERDLADVLDQRRNAVVDGDDDVADVVERSHPADPADVIELPALGVEAAAAIAVVGAERAFDLLRRQARAGEAILVEQHLILHRPAAKAAIVGDAGDRLDIAARPSSPRTS